MGYYEFRHNDDFARICRMLNFNISLPAAGAFCWHGRNRMPENRLFVIVGPEQGRGGEIINHSNNGETLILERGYTYFMPRDLDLEFNFLSGLELGSFHFSLELFSGWDIFAEQKKCRRCKSSDSASGFVDMMYDRDFQFDSAIALRGICFQLVARFCPQNLSDVKQAHILNERYGKMLEFIRNQADARTGIDDLAEISGMSRDRLSRVFSRDAGIPLKKYLERELIRKASHILIADKTVRETAEKLNFSSEYYFSRFFRKHTGFPPGRYRRDRQCAGAI
jgi:AraC-like DNA-binding protein